MGIKRVMTGSPWHVEKMVREEGDPRRHRSRCVFYNKANAYCPKVVGKCVGAAHCNFYEEERVEEVVFINPVIADKKAFQGIKMIAMTDIEVSNKFKPPSKKKIDEVVQYYKEHGIIDEPVSVTCHSKKYKLEDKYLRYYVAKQLGLKEIPAKIGTAEGNKLEAAIRTVGTKVKHRKYGDGKVISITENNINVAFESGKEVMFNVERCVKDRILAVVYGEVF